MVESAGGAIVDSTARSGAGNDDGKKNGNAMRAEEAASGRDEGGGGSSGWTSETVFLERDEQKSEETLVQMELDWSSGLPHLFQGGADRSAFNSL